MSKLIFVLQLISYVVTVIVFSVAMIWVAMPTDDSIAARQLEQCLLISREIPIDELRYNVTRACFGQYFLDGAVNEQ